MTRLEEGNWVIFLPKDPKHNQHQRGQRNFDNDDNDDDADDDDDNYNVFSSSQRTSNRVGTKGKGRGGNKL